MPSRDEILDECYATVRKNRTAEKSLVDLYYELENCATSKGKDLGVIDTNLMEIELSQRKQDSARIQYLKQLKYFHNKNSSYDFSRLKQAANTLNEIRFESMPGELQDAFRAAEELAKGEIANSVKTVAQSLTTRRIPFLRKASKKYKKKKNRDNDGAAIKGNCTI